MPARRPLRQLNLLLLWLALSGLSGWGAYLLAQRLGIADLRATGMHRLELYGASLQREIGKYAFLPDVLALEGNVQRLLAEPGDEQLTNRVNAYLEQLNDRAGTLTAYLVDARGHVVASSNWRRTSGYMGGQGARGASQAITPPAFISALAARKPAWRFSWLIRGSQRW